MRMTIMAALAALSLHASWAADPVMHFDVKPGLWETTSKNEVSGMSNTPAMPQIPEETLAKLPPAQRAQLEARMKGGAGALHTNTSKSCITPEALNRGMHFGQDDNSCTYKVVSSSSIRQELQTECTRGRQKVTGDITTERVDSEHVKGVIVMKSGEGGPSFNMKMSFDTKWLASDCGDVKPPAVK